MPTVFTYSAVTLAIAGSLGQEVISKRLLVAEATASIVPDLHVLALRFGVAFLRPFPDEHFFAPIQAMEAAPLRFARFWSLKEVGVSWPADLWIWLGLFGARNEKLWKAGCQEIDGCASALDVEHNNPIQPTVKSSACFIRRTQTLEERIVIMSWQYSQRTGQLTRNGRTVGYGYSGAPAGRNKPQMQQIRNIGPIPQGRYRIGAPRITDEHGPHVMELTPIGHHAFGRRGFLIHRERRNGPPGNASQGCVIFGPIIRHQISASGDRELVATE